MNPQAQRPDIVWYDDEFKSGLMLALALHVLLLMVAFIVGRIVFPTGSAKGAALEVLKASVRVDVVGMPKMTLQELRQLQATPAASKEPEPVKEAKAEPAEAPPKPDDVVIQEKGRPSAKKSLSSLLADYSKKAPTAKKERKGGAEGKNAGLDELVLEGNRLSRGTALVGDVSDTADGPLVAYVENLMEKVRAHWALPDFLRGANLQCRVQIWVSASGQLLKAEFIEKSGNADYDNRAEQAIRRASPFPPPPADVAAKLSTRGVVLGFPL